MCVHACVRASMCVCEMINFPDTFNFGHPTFRYSSMKVISQVRASYMTNIIPNFKQDCLMADMSMKTVPSRVVLLGHSSHSPGT